MNAGSSRSHSVFSILLEVNHQQDLCIYTYVLCSLYVLLQFLYKRFALSISEVFFHSRVIVACVLTTGCILAMS